MGLARRGPVAEFVSVRHIPIMVEAGHKSKGPE
jgi:hypothetical protein